jgi:hypothetical protein
VFRKILDKTHESSFFVLYSACHQRCGRFVERTDFRVVTRHDLIEWSRDVSANDSFQPLPLHCDACAEDVQATHVRIVRDGDPIARTVVPQVEIKKFKPKDWILKLKETL